MQETLEGFSNMENRGQKKSISKASNSFHAQGHRNQPKSSRCYSELEAALPRKKMKRYLKSGQPKYKLAMFRDGGDACLTGVDLI